MDRCKCHQLAEDFTFGSSSEQQVFHIAETWQQRLQGAAKAGPGTDAKEIFGTGIEKNNCAVGIDDQYGGGETAENVTRQGRGIGAGDCF